MPHRDMRAPSRDGGGANKEGVILGLTRGLAKELAPHITVNAVCPGIVDTPRTATTVAMTATCITINTVQMPPKVAAPRLAAPTCRNCRLVIGLIGLVTDFAFKYKIPMDVITAGAASGQSA